MVVVDLLVLAYTIACSILWHQQLLRGLNISWNAYTNYAKADRCRVDKMRPETVGQTDARIVVKAVSAGRNSPEVSP